MLVADASAKVYDMTLIIPISTRNPHEKGVVLNNQVASVFLKLPISEPDRLKRFKKTKKYMDGLKYGVTMPIFIFLIKVFLGMLPPSLGRYFQEKYASKATLIFSNVPGPRTLRKIRGSEIGAMFGFVPLVGFQQAGFGCFSYAGRLSLSMIVNPSSIKDPNRFCTIFREELAELQRLAHDINRSTVEKKNDEKVREVTKLVAKHEASPMPYSVTSARLDDAHEEQVDEAELKKLGQRDLRTMHRSVMRN